MTINQIIYNIRRELKDTSDDVKLSDRNIEFIVNFLREKLIVQQLQKGRSISSNIKQDFGQVAVEKVDLNDNGILKTNKFIFRTVLELPVPIELDQKDCFTYIGGLDKQSPIDFKTKALAIWNKHNKYSSKLQVAYYNNKRIYINNCPNPNLRYINIEGVFANPREVSKFNKPNGQPCYNPDVDNYPISGRMLDMINSLFKKELDLFYQLPEDITNDASNVT
jgi:hypothetical protein